MCVLLLGMLLGFIEFVGEVVGLKEVEFESNVC